MEADLSLLKLDPALWRKRFRSQAARLEWGSVIRRKRDGDSTFRKSTELGSACHVTSVQASDAIQDERQKV